MKKYTSKTIALSLILCLSTTQISLTCFEDWCMSEKEIEQRKQKKREEETLRKETYEGYIAQNAHNLKGIPEQDIDDISNKLKEQLKNLSYKKLQDNNDINNKIKNVIIENSNDKAKKIASMITNNPTEIYIVVNSTNKKIRDRIKETPNNINGLALKQFFGAPLHDWVGNTIDEYRKAERQRIERERIEREIRRIERERKEKERKTTCEGYIAQTAHDLKGIPTNYIDNIIRDLNQKLQYLNYQKIHNKDYTNQIIRNIIIENIKSEVKRHASKATNDSSIINKIIKSVDEKVRIRMTKTSHISGLALNEFFGYEFNNSIKNKAERKRIKIERERRKRIEKEKKARIERQRIERKNRERIEKERVERIKRERNRKIENHLTQLRSELQPSQQKDVNKIIKASRKKLNLLGNNELENKNTVYNIFNTIIIEYAKNESCRMVSQYSDDKEAIEKTTESMEKNVRAILKKNKNAVNGRALCNYFGKDLDLKVRKNLEDRSREQARQIERARDQTRQREIEQARQAKRARKEARQAKRARKEARRIKRANEEKEKKARAPQPYRQTHTSKKYNPGRPQPSCSSGISCAS